MQELLVPVVEVVMVRVSHRVAASGDCPAFTLTILTHPLADRHTGRADPLPPITNHKGHRSRQRSRNRRSLAQGVVARTPTVGTLRTPTNTRRPAGGATPRITATTATSTITIILHPPDHTVG